MTSEGIVETRHELKKSFVLITAVGGQLLLRENHKLKRSALWETIGMERCIVAGQNQYDIMYIYIYIYIIYIIYIYILYIYIDSDSTTENGGISGDTSYKYV